MKKNLAYMVVAIFLLACNNDMEEVIVEENETNVGLLKSADVGLPPGIANLYESVPNSQVSDDFETLNWWRWTHRTESNPAEWGTGTDFVKIVDGSYVSIKGDYDTVSKGSGLSARHSSQYGFYVTRWRHVGSLIGWHDAIWTAGRNFGYVEESIPDVNNVMRLEIDIMERDWMSPAKWNAKVHGWGPNGVHVAKKLRDTEEGSEWTDWTIDAVEYNPNYVRAWEYRNGAWSSFSPIYFSNSNDGMYLHEDFRKPLYAILSIKKGVKNMQWPESDGWLHVDYYRVYDLK